MQMLTDNGYIWRSYKQYKNTHGAGKQTETGKERG